MRSMKTQETWQYWIRFAGSPYASILRSVIGRDRFLNEDDAREAAAVLYPNAEFELWQASSHQGFDIQRAS